MQKESRKDVNKFSGSYVAQQGTTTVLLLQEKSRPAAMQLSRMQVEHVRSAELEGLAAILRAP